MADILGQITEAVAGTMSGGGADAAEDEAVAAKEPAPQPLEILLRDYYAKVGASERLNDGIARMGGTALPILITVFGLLTVNKSLAAEVFWLVPLVLVFLVGMLMQMTYRSVLLSYYVRDLEKQIEGMAGTTPFNYENLTGQALYSPRTGTPAFLVLYGMYFIVIATAYFGLIVYCFHTLQTKFDIRPALQACYIGFYSLTTAIMVWAFAFYLTGMRALYTSWARALAGKGARPRDTHTPALLRYILLPRPFDFLVKTPITVANAFIAAHLLGVSLAHHWALLVAVIGCVELLAKQATYIWNDLLDAEADRAHAHKRRRYFAAVESNALGKPLLITRTLAAFGVAVLLAVKVNMALLPPLVAAIFLIQFAYDRYAKPHPPARLGLAALAYAERAVAGAIVPLSIAARSAPSSPARTVVVLSVWTVAFALLFLAASWYAEEEYRMRTERNAHVRRDGKAWFLRYAPRIEIVANLALVPLGLWMADDAPHGSAGYALIGAGIAGVAVIWALLTVSGRRHARIADLIGSPNGHIQGPTRRCVVPEWNRYVLYVVIAGIVGGYALVVRSTPSFPFILAFVFPVSMAALYAYATYEELNFFNLKPTILLTMRVLNQMVFTKQTVGEILHTLQPHTHPGTPPEHGAAPDDRNDGRIPRTNPTAVSGRHPHT